MLKGHYSLQLICDTIQNFKNKKKPEEILFTFQKVNSRWDLLCCYYMYSLDATLSANKLFILISLPGFIPIDL